MPIKIVFKSNIVPRDVPPEQQIVAPEEEIVVPPEIQAEPPEKKSKKKVEKPLVSKKTKRVKSKK